MVENIYRSRKPSESPLWQCLSLHFQEFLAEYEEKYEKKYGYLRSIVVEVVNKFLECGDLTRGFARVVCGACRHEYLLAFSCRGRWFCPSCHEKKVMQFGEFIVNTVAFPVPHRQYVFTIPIMLRAYFKYSRELLTKLCHVAEESLLEYLRETLSLPEGQLGMVMAIHTFGEYLNSHPHLHAVAADGLFARSGTFYVLPRRSLKPLEELFRVKVIRLLVDEGLLAERMADKLLTWKHNGFSIDNGAPVKRKDREGLERLAQYIIRNPFSEEKMIYDEDGGTVIYHSKVNAKTNRNFEVYAIGEFIAAIAQHIPDKGFQLVRYYGWYSNKSRGMRAKEQEVEAEKGSEESDVEIIDISGYTPPHVPSKRWRELIKKVWLVLRSDTSQSSRS